MEVLPRKENKMGILPVGKLIFTMSAPMVLSMLFQALYNVVDSIFVARLGQDAMNAVSLAFPLQTILIGVSVGTGVGMNALISRSLGEKHFFRADEAANTGIFLYLCSAILFGVIGMVIPGPYYHLLTENSQIISYGSAYIHICLGCALAVFAQVCSERLLQSTGRTGLAMIPQMTGAVLNMILDPIMIFGLFGFPRLEVAGAATATVCGQVVAAVIGFALNLKKNPEIHIRARLIRFQGAIAGEIYRIGLPSIVMQCIGSLMNFCLNSILISFTEAATAVFGAYFKIQSFVFLPVFGMNNALVPVISYNYGARRADRVRAAVKIGIVSAIGVMTVGFILFETIPEVLLGLFSPSAEMLSVGIPAFRTIGFTFPVAGFCILAGSVCQALGRPMYSLLTSIFRQLAVLLPAAYLLSLSGRLELVWLAFPIAEVVSLIFSAVFLRRTYRQTGISVRHAPMSEQPDNPGQE